MDKVRVEFCHRRDEAEKFIIDKAAVPGGW